MNFNSFQFLIFFPIALLGYYCLPHKIRYLWLLACSYYFYAQWNARYTILLLISTVITFLSGIGIGHEIEKNGKNSRGKKKWVAISFLLNLGILAFFKYGNFAVDNLNLLFGMTGTSERIKRFDILLPVGISFYTFQALSYTMDVYRGDTKVQKNFFKYALFVSFFPQLVAGPIERSSNLLEQIDEVHPLRFEQLRSGLLLMIWGFFIKMVIADRIAILVDNLYASYTEYAGWYMIIAAILFPVQIYCDFAGYSTIARGAAEMMGFRLTDNFNAPFLSQSIAEFWRRWHITLSTWFRDYLYFPLGGNRKGKVRTAFNVMVVFLVSGLWHGANWTFVIWGAVNGALQILGAWLKPLRDRLISLFQIRRESAGHRLVCTFLTYCMVCFTFVFFRANTTQDAIAILGGILKAKNIWILFDGSLLTLGLDQGNWSVLLIAMMILIASDIFRYRNFSVRQVIGSQNMWLRILVPVVGILSILVFGIWGSGFNEASFIYFQF